MPTGKEKQFSVAEPMKTILTYTHYWERAVTIIYLEILGFFLEGYFQLCVWGEITEGLFPCEAGAVGSLWPGRRRAQVRGESRLSRPLLCQCGVNR